MATHTQRGGVSVDAFQWTGGVLVLHSLPAWAQLLALHTPGDGSLIVPIRTGTARAVATDWVLRSTDGGVEVIPNASFTALYT